MTPHRRGLLVVNYRSYFSVPLRTHFPLLPLNRPCETFRHLLNGPTGIFPGMYRLSKFLPTVFGVTHLICPFTLDNNRISTCSVSNKISLGEKFSLLFLAAMFDRRTKYIRSWVLTTHLVVRILTLTYVKLTTGKS